VTWTSEPLSCPHCGAQIDADDDVLLLFLSGTNIIVFGCAACRKVINVLPPVELRGRTWRTHFAWRWFPVRRRAFRGAELPRGADLPRGAGVNPLEEDEGGTAA
jgi:hypothetical protein